MISPLMLSQPLVVVTPANATDRYGDVSEDWAQATRTTVHGRLVQASEEEIITAKRDADASEWFAVVPADTAIDQRCRVEADGFTYAVRGKPRPVRGAYGVSHLEVELSLVKG